MIARTFTPLVIDNESIPERLFCANAIFAKPEPVGVITHYRPVLRFSLTTKEDFFVR